MRSAVIFLDESGDLGWKFGSPYRNGGSSRYLTISAIITPFDKQHLHLPNRLIKKLYIKHNWPINEEKKWAKMNKQERFNFTEQAYQLIESHTDIKYVSITVYKPKVYEYIRNDGNKLYNYMIGLILLDKIKEFDEVIFSPDPRSIKVKSGNSLPDYLQTKLWVECRVKTQLIYRPHDSASNKGVQFADMLSGAIQQHFEDNNSTLFNMLTEHLKIQTLYF